MIHSFSSFILQQDPSPFHEDVDHVSVNDVKQEAALRAMQALKKHGDDVSIDIAASFDRNPGIVMQAYHWAYRDALRKKLGRSPRTRAGVVGEGLIQLDHLPDNRERAEDGLTVLDQYPESDLGRMYRCGLHGLSIEKTRHVIGTMADIQRLKSEDHGRVPDAIRQRVRRLRVETGLALDIGLL